MKKGREREETCVIPNLIGCCEGQKAKCEVLCKVHNSIENKELLFLLFDYHYLSNYQLNIFLIIPQFCSKIQLEVALSNA